ncbi:hypothetical protein [Porphyromonas levii]|uniref:DUF4407 domain-containing protein n=1 Tax=Porphyromonas levii TaxID=28114 RepID=A0A4Y8WNG9_9PORP|nr:hypothetical protein [Porphyromonas levii]TFH94329.1 hypothetical protein E4P47_07955 [Porphyromonas levii]TFH95249.1 hypothetical protein E4P48_08420 [Porphyromonas levii]
MDKDFLRKLVAFLFYVAFAGISCWATAESLHLLLPSWPVVFCWVVSIGFFVIASYGSKLVVDSLNTNIYLEKRPAKLFGGVLLMLVFWLCCSFPTNMHTFFYRSAINDIALQDVQKTNSYIDQLANNTQINRSIEKNIENLEREVEAALTGLENEIDNLANPGFGDRSKEHLTKIAKAVGVDVIAELSYRGTSPQQRKLLKDQYRKIAYQHMNNRIATIKESGEKAKQQEYVPKARSLAEKLMQATQLLSEHKAKGEVVNNLISNSDALLTQSYGLIRTYRSLINILEEDEAIYLTDNGVSRTHRMLSVIDVWQDYFDGKFKGRGVGYWILLALLVDIAAMVLFSYTFRREE